ncbi:MAG: hypothetical protein HIU82_12550 [Proteobacteria bacterium]|nr:hypothetical protein [Pseudomonadota bacterium]
MSATTPTPNDQWLRKCSLIVGAPDGRTLDLSEFKISFHVSQSDVLTPNTLRCKVYNVATATTTLITKEFTTVLLQAGYVTGNYGFIFRGTIVQTMVGADNAVDHFIEIFAADGDQALNFGITNVTLAPGATIASAQAAVAQAMAAADPTFTGGSPTGATGGILPRGKVLFGLSRDHLHTLGLTAGGRYSVQSGRLVFIPDTGYLPGDIVKLNAGTGLIGIPRTTEGGVEMTALLNPNIIVGQRVQIENKQLNTVNNRGTPQPSYQNPFGGMFASTAADGIYRVMVHEFEGDTRGNPWYSHLVCLSVNPSAAPSAAVALT